MGSQVNANSLVVMTAGAGQRPMPGHYVSHTATSCDEQQLVNWQI